jgi:hypothetical protein
MRDKKGEETRIYLLSDVLLHKPRRFCHTHVLATAGPGKRSPRSSPQHCALLSAVAIRISQFVSSFN